MLSVHHRIAHDVYDLPGSTPWFLDRARSVVTSFIGSQMLAACDELHKILVAGDHHHRHPCASSLWESVR